MPRTPTPTYCFALVVVRREDRFLMVRECKQHEGWYLPAGQVEPGERLVDAAVRETLEEGGVPVVLDGVLRVEHTPRADGSARLRVFFLAHPVDDTPPKSQPDAHSLGAAWMRLDELEGLPLRGEEARQVLRFVHAGGQPVPLEVLCTETTGWPAADPPG
jgi:ADP-ribose pyrophosphatase YjhB (NUDIX family)